MAIIVTQTAHSAWDIKEAFAALNRDYYPRCVYEAIYNYFEDTCDEGAYCRLDVISWCCAITSHELKDYPEFEDVEELADHLRKEYNLLCYDKKTKTAYTID